MSVSIENGDELGLVARYARELSGVAPDYRVRKRPDGDYIVFDFAYPSEHLFDALNRVNDDLDASNQFKDRVGIAVRSKKPMFPLQMSETERLQRELAASLTVDKYTFGEEFLNRYTASVTALEKQVVVQANYIVYGRRGSGKSSLLAYAMHKLRIGNEPFCWIAMQTYSGRDDNQAIASVLGELFSEAVPYTRTPDEFVDLANELQKLGESGDSNVVGERLTRLTPRMRRMLGGIASAGKYFTVFLDDIHVVGRDLQPILLGVIYSLTRGNRAVIKASGIEQFTNLWDGNSRKGLEAPHDVQTLMLDHNLTTPDQSRDHIVNILDRHARYCGLPNIRYIAPDKLLDRLVLAAAAVPRDALSLFSKAIARSLAKRQRMISITSLNAATSEAIEEKLKDVEKDVLDSEKAAVLDDLERVKRFCLVTHKKNAFLVKIANSSAGYIGIQRLVALRFVHILHEGITPHRAGERFVALMLDYGFYIGIRAAKSIALVPDSPRALLARELRTLPILSV